MKHHISTVTEKDVKLYFKGDDWRLFPYGDELKASGDFAEITLKPVKTVFNVKIENIDDPIDSAEEETEDPIKFIVKYLQTGTEGDEVFRKMSSHPQNVSYMLSLLASEFDQKRLSPEILVENLNRIIFSVNQSADKFQPSPKVPDDIDDLLSYSAEHTYEGDDIEDSYIRNKSHSQKIDQVPTELKELLSKMKSKDWDAKLGGDKLTVNIQDLFTAEIIIDKIIWEYDFQIRGFKESRKTGKTEDPIAEFRRYYKDPEIQAVHEAAKADYLEKEESEKHRSTKKPNKVSPYSNTEFDSLGSPP